MRNSQTTSRPGSVGPSIFAGGASVFFRIILGFEDAISKYSFAEKLVGCSYLWMFGLMMLSLLVWLVRIVFWVHGLRGNNGASISFEAKLSKQEPVDFLFWTFVVCLSIVFVLAPLEELDNRRKRIAALRSALKRDTNTEIEPALRELGALANQGGRYSARLADVLLEALADPDASVRAQATVSIGAIKVRTNDKTNAHLAHVVRRLIEALKDEDSAVRKGAAVALSRLEAEEAVEALTTRLSDRDIGVRHAAADALAAIAPRRAITAFVRYLADSDPKIVKDAKEALIDLGDEAVQPLVESLDGLASLLPRMRANVLSTLGFIGAPPGGALAEQGIVALLRALKDGDSTVRAAAVEALGRTGQALALEPLMVALKDPSRHVRIRASQALAEIGSAKAVRCLVGSLADVERGPLFAPDFNPTGAHAAMRSLIKLCGEDGATDVLLEALTDSNPELRREAARWLSHRPGEKAGSALIRAITDVNPRVRSGAVEALGYRGGDYELKAIIAMLGDSNAEVRRSAVRALAPGFEVESRPDMPEDWILSILQEMKADPNSDVRAGTFGALARIGALQKPEILRQVLCVRDPDSVRGVIEGLLTLDYLDSSEAGGILEGWVTERESVGRISIAVFEDRFANRSVRECAIKVLARIADKNSSSDVLGVLSKSLGHEDAAIRQAAHNAFRWIRKELADEILRTAGDDPDVRVREGAMMAKEIHAEFKMRFPD